MRELVEKMKIISKAIDDIDINDFNASDKKMEQRIHKLTKSSDYKEMIELFETLNKDEKDNTIEKEIINNFLEIAKVDPLNLNTLQYEIQKIVSGLNLKIDEDYQDGRKILERNINKKISYIDVKYNLSYLTNQILEKIFVMPKYQRGYVWDIEKVSSLIYSLLRGIPIPNLYGYNTYDDEKDKNITEIIDGQQRLTSIVMYYYGIFPKFKVRSINYSEHMNEIAILCEYYYNPEKYKKIAENLLSKSQKDYDDRIGKIDNAEDILNKEYKLNIDVEFLISLANEDGSHKIINISYRDSKNNKSHLTQREKTNLMNSALTFVLVQGDTDITSETIDIFTIYNSAGEPLGAQEIRNGVYYKNIVYKEINAFNEETGRIAGSNNIRNESWNNIRNKSTIKADVQQLFFMLACAYDIDKKFKGFDKLIEKNRAMELLKDKQLDLINTYSKYISNNGNDKKMLDSEVKSIKNFFSMEFENQRGINKNIKNYVIIFIILKNKGYLNNDNLDYTKEKIPVDALTYNNSRKTPNQGYLSVNQIVEIYDILSEKGDLF